MNRTNTLLVVSFNTSDESVRRWEEFIVFDSSSDVKVSEIEDAFSSYIETSYGDKSYTEIVDDVLCSFDGFEYHMFSGDDPAYIGDVRIIYV